MLKKPSPAEDADMTNLIQSNKAIRKELKKGQEQGKLLFDASKNQN